MCTVTYIPGKEGCFITSSRDEHTVRPSAIDPDVYVHNGIEIIYPKDLKAHGSWIAYAQNGNAAVLLNGAFKRHITCQPYRKSRGMVLLDIISHNEPEVCFSEIDLNNIEPFTLVLFVKGMLYESRWDGRQKYLLKIDETVPYIWSSATLYTPAVIQKRKEWFEMWLMQTPKPDMASILNFHLFAGDGDCDNSILMNRNSEILTVSITSLDISYDAASIHYYDLREKRRTIKSIEFELTGV